MKNKTVVKVSPKVDYHGFYVLIVPDAAAGSRGMHTVYRIPSHCVILNSNDAAVTRLSGISVIGRELPIGLAEEVARKCGK